MRQSAFDFIHCWYIFHPEIHFIKLGLYFRDIIFNIWLFRTKNISRYYI